MGRVARQEGHPALKNPRFKNPMTAQNHSMALSPWQPLSGQRVLGISRLDRRTHDRGDEKKFKVCTVNIGTLKGRGREIVDMLKRRKADICCVQEVRYRGKSTISFGEGDDKYKLWYSGNEDGSNGVGIFACQELTENVIEVVRYSDRLMKVKMVLGSKLYHIFSVYAPQVGRPTSEKEEFLEFLEDEIASIPTSDGIFVAGDFNCHIGRNRDGYEAVMGSFGIGESNGEGLALLD